MSDNILSNANFSGQLYEITAKTRRGEANALRRGFNKIHRRYAPAFSESVPRGAAAHVIARIRGHNWSRNPDLIALRKIGYTPYTRRNDPTFVPKPMRITPRSESREALNALSLAMAANCDYNPESAYPFEVMCSAEDLAKAMGVLHVYDDGRKAYDIALNALNVLDELKYCIIQREIDPDVGQNKPMRIWLTPEFFLSRGMTIEEVRSLLHKFRQWAIKHGLTEGLKRKYERHLLRMARFGIDIDDRHSLKNMLKKVRRQVVSPELLNDKNAVVIDLGAHLDKLNRTQKSQRDNKPNKRPFYQAFIKWSTGGQVATHQVINLQMSLTSERPELLNTDSETFYRILLERAGII
ncbi:Replication protein [Serratia plymuthica]|uniref:Replication protein n=1 Tax=Serratia plymuthica TaxID=82996 RepID=UPI00030F957D|nr:Replication protein [Serratia plymuthica]